jgi:signal transduction histidine kinase/DNA-binding response OmpR family regulator
MELISLPLPDDGPFGQEWTHARPDGSRITLAFSVYTLRDDNGRPNGVVALARDITQLKALERMKNEFISTVSHELRTPLTSIRGALGLVAGGATGALPEKAAELVTIAHRNSERLVHIINDILDIEKIESGRLAIHIQAVDAADILKQAVEANQAYAARYDVKLLVNEVPEDTRVLADPERLMQVVTNLLSNAAKFSPQGGEVWIGAAPRGSFLRISVRDFGAGIPVEFRNRIFEKFAQADGNDARRRDGTGLGLSITKKLVEAMQGFIDFETETGKGTVFHVDLPMGAVPVAGGDDYQEDGGSEATRPQRVLICEDDADVGALLRLLLERAGLAADVAGTLAEARASLRRRGDRGYAAVTLDLMLPDGSGLALLRELRRDPETRSLPVIVISARAEEGRRELNGDAIGMVDWMTKPIDEQRLVDALHRAVGDAGRPRILHIEDDADFREVLARSLRDAAEWVGAATLREAEASLASGKFDLVVLDLDLPDGSGLSLLERLKTLPGGPVPVLILSASEMDNGIRKKVEAALVKSRLSEERIVQTILDQIRKVSRTQGGQPA